MCFYIGCIVYKYSVVWVILAQKTAKMVRKVAYGGDFSHCYDSLLDLCPF
jgi:hypothetical protein